MSESHKILKKTTIKSSVYGVMITTFGVVVATLATSYTSFGAMTLELLIQAQKTTPALWVLDIMPFALLLWGKQVSTKLVSVAHTIISTQSDEMWHKTQEMRKQIEIEKNHDPLTLLPNEHQFLHEIDTAIKNIAQPHDDAGIVQAISDYLPKGKDEGDSLAVILLDIDNFKEINSTLGIDNGDAVLIDIGQRLKASVEDSDVLISRIGGDDFALLKVGCDESSAIALVEKIRKAFEQSFDIEGFSAMLGVSVGISLFPDHGDTAKELLQNAEIAMYSGKKEASDYTVYSHALNVHSLDDLILKTEIRRAFDQDEFCLHYQPKVDCDNQVNEVEALVRWIHPERGLIPPDKFIPMIVQKRMNGELLRRILKLALIQAKAWKEDNLHVRIALNLTAFDLLEPDLPEMIADMLREYSLESDVLKLEITETTLVENQELTLVALNALSEMGIPTSIDDFGTGYSSLGYLSKLPITEVKIDRSFIMDMNSNQRNDKIIQGIIALSHSLSLHTVAEGVEDAETMTYLKSLDCDFIQGYHISRPLEGKLFGLWLKAWQEANRMPTDASKNKT